MAKRYFAARPARKDVAWTFAGLRPLLADPKDRPRASRAITCSISTPSAAPLLSIFGGKLTTYRKLAEDVVDQLAPRLGKRAGHWTAGSPCRAATCRTPTSTLTGPR